jgi:uncharacterized protein
MNAPPERPRSRLDIVDALRGLALLGIIIVNVMTFAAGVGGDSLGGLDDKSSAADLFTYMITALFFEYKFYPLFAAMFGFGAAELWHRWATGKRPIGPAWIRRMAILALLGLGNGVLLYAGDVLTRYAIAGIIFWLFSPRSMSARQAFQRAWIWGAIAVLSGLGFGLLLSAMVESGETMREFIGRDTAAYTIYAWGTFSQVTEQRASDYATILASSVFFALPSFVACMYLGYALHRSRFLQRALREPRRAWRWVSMGLVFGVPLNIIYAIVKTAGQIRQEPAMLGYESMLAIPISSLCFAYVGAFILIWPFLRPGMQDLLGRLGRVSLSNYLATAGVLSLLLYGYGFGWGDDLRQAQLFVVAVAVWIAVAAASLVWQRVFTRGLVEPLLRR